MHLKDPLELLLQRIREHGDIAKVQELCLDEIPIRTFTNEIKGLLERCISLEHLTLRACQIESLDNFPDLRKLVKLDLGENSLYDQHLGALNHLVLLRELNLDSNNLEKIELIEQVCRSLSLISINLWNNPASKNDQYMNTLFNRVECLQLIDNIDRSGGYTRSENSDSQNLSDACDSLEESEPEKRVKSDEN